MNSVLLSVRSLMQMFEGKAKEFMNEIDNVHMVWLEEIQQEANRIFSRDFNAAPELMPKTPSQKKNSRRKRVSLGRQEESQTRRRFSRGRRSNLRGSPVKSLNLIAEEPIAEGSSSQASNTAQPKRTTRKNKQTKPDVTGEENTSVDDNDAEASHNEKPVLPNKDVDKKDETNAEGVTYEQACDAALSPPKIPLPEVVVRISSEERLSAEFVQQLEDSPGRKAVKVPIAKPPRKTRRSSARCSLKVRHSLAGLRHSMTQASVHRASQRSMLKKKATRTNNSTCSSNIDEDSPMDTTDENDHVHSETEPVPAEAPSAEAVPEISEDNSQEPVNAPLERITRSMAANSEKLAPSSMPTSKPKVSSPVKTDVGEKQQGAKIVRQSSRSTKRKAPDTIEDSPTKRLSPPKKTQSAVKPSMRSFLHTVQKNQMLMMTPNSLGRSGVIKSFIKHTTPLKIDSKMSLGFVTKERYKLEALKKKQEQEEERMRKMEEEKRKKQEELKRKRDERIRRVLEAKGKEEQREEEKKKKIEQKMAQIDEKNDKRQADEKAKKKVAMKRQEELELKKKLEEEAKKKKLQQLEEEKRQQELMAKKKAEEEEQVRRALELKREQERERELERERQAAAERERKEKEKALALQRELERAVREKEMRELEERRKALEEKRKLEEQQRMAEKEKALKEREEARLKEVAAEKKTVAVLNMTVDLEKSVLNTPDKKGCGLNGTYNVESSPQSYAITPKGANKPLVTSKNLDDYGMDQNSDDSTDDESAPRKPIPSWAEGPYLKQIIMKQYFNPPDLDSYFGTVEPPKLENIFYKSKPRYFKRTSSAVWHSPPAGAK
ncbi:inner centromere protein isoform X1 [Oryzias latipes]|uniref:Inner centromere protein n=1 Tax=Oryzias latipes TaxID=8090 RepID=A0A3B3H765_ORYLA|nr:inner centromere protein isoform X1 [Oryzias latipes]XP_020559319.1 inner centromere protein isoform X1 [Oryzias latipes]